MSNTTKTILWWGRFDPAYSRNGVMRGHLAALGYRVIDFFPRFCTFGDLEAALRRLPTPDAVWVPCFRQRDLAAARRWSRRRRVPLIFDPLISAYDKQVFERAKVAEESAHARRLLAWERGLFAQADLLLADTACHADFFVDTLGAAREKTHLVYVGAEEGRFCPAPLQPKDGPTEVLFYGSFIPLHGAETIVQAAQRYQGPPVRWCLLGDGPTRHACETLAQGCPSILFEQPIPYAELPARIHRADILLGVFGTTPKAGRVIPNKVFQALAAGRPVITRHSDAYPEKCRESRALAFVPPGDPGALAEAVAHWASPADAPNARAHDARALYDACFSSDPIRHQLVTALDHLQFKA